ncbi:hypothetical protein EML15_04915 [Corynebacterium sp. sy017]|uniref:hypothetical protein n=1 Tax=unclassified Corynebacterium TaxID=2624378 RepID=UPI001184CF12|nr:MULTISPECIES: hypothetical protein [unclassified Corynebacterium]MBP3088486.1 hypothetical protein [Corynebacterium sp. sy017]TSD91792.1 hypothetical protein ELY17_04915 [Corynebacterium sp. SY003]
MIHRILEVIRQSQQVHFGENSMAWCDETFFAFSQKDTELPFQCQKAVGKMRFKQEKISAFSAVTSENEGFYQIVSCDSATDDMRVALLGAMEPGARFVSDKARLPSGFHTTRRKSYYHSWQTKQWLPDEN